MIELFSNCMPALVRLIGFACVITSNVSAAEEFLPDWAAKAPQNKIDLAYDRSSNTEANGERLRVACQALKAGDRLVLQAGVYSVAKLWKLDCSGEPYKPIWIEAAEGAKVVITRPGILSRISLSSTSVSIRKFSLFEFRLEFRGGSHGIRLQHCHDLASSLREVLPNGGRVEPRIRTILITSICWQRDSRWRPQVPVKACILAAITQV
ncbi:MAG: hypothetical protein U0930_05635 [Pirellulales bacterium]